MSGEGEAWAGYTAADQRADAAFLVGVTHGRAEARAAVEAELLLEWRSLPVWGPNPQGLHILDDVDHESLMDDVKRICRGEPKPFQSSRATRKATATDLDPPS